MKVFLTFMLGCVVLTTAQHLNNNLCVGRMDGIVLPDARSCDEYFQCQGGQMTRQRCQPGTLFDLNLYYCSIEHAVNCGARTKPVAVRPPNSPDAPPSPESHHSVCRGQRNGLLLANPSNCRAYIECQQSLRLDRECKAGELFEAQSGVCLSDFSVDCGNRQIPSQNGDGNVIRPNAPLLPSDGSVSREICRNMPTGTRISNPENCRSYFECRNNERTEFTCPANQSFDTARGQCSASNLVNCGSRRNVVSQSQQNAMCQGQRNGARLANQNNCRAYVECQGNARIERQCENGQLFDTQLKNCLPAHTVRCGARGLPPADIDVRSPEDFFPPCPRNGVIFRTHPHDCQKYFICAEGTLIQHTCANGIRFNPDTLECDFPQNVQCRNNQILIPQTPLLPDCSYGETHFPNLVSCNQYFMCVKDEPRAMKCPTGHLWNNQNKKCEKSNTTSCARSFDGRSYAYSPARDDEKKA